jgi:hypothetical protein
MIVVQFFRKDHIFWNSKVRHFFRKGSPVNPVLALSTTTAMKQKCFNVPTGESAVNYSWGLFAGWALILPMEDLNFVLHHQISS